MVALDDRKSDTNPADLDIIGNLALELGVTLNEDAQQEAPAAVGRQDHRRQRAQTDS